jgi:hypothetical protein
MQIPDTLADRYARIHHDYQGDHCSTFDRLDKPDACQEGSDDAQAGTIDANCFDQFMEDFYRTMCLANKYTTALYFFSQRQLGPM